METPTGEGLNWRQLQQLDSNTVTFTTQTISGSNGQQLLDNEDARSIRSLGSRVSNAASTYSAATFYSFSTSNYSGFSGAGELVRRQQQKRHHVNPQDLDPNAVYDVDWVQDDATNKCMVCNAEFSPLLRRKHHCRACGRVVCSGCSRSRLTVVGLRGPQKACNDCFKEYEKIRACESICEDTDPGRQAEEHQHRASHLLQANHENKAMEKKIEGEKQEEEGAAHLLRQQQQGGINGASILMLSSSRRGDDVKIAPPPQAEILPHPTSDDEVEVEAAAAAKQEREEAFPTRGGSLAPRVTPMRKLSSTSSFPAFTAEDKEGSRQRRKSSSYASKSRKSNSEGGAGNSGDKGGKMSYGFLAIGCAALAVTSIVLMKGRVFK